jgi:hypothetical protein
MVQDPVMHLYASSLLESLRLAATGQSTSSNHAGTVPLVIAAVVLFVAAVVVRKIIKLAIIVVLVAIVALVLAGYRSGLFG